MKIKYDKILGKLREEDTGTTPSSSTSLFVIYDNLGVAVLDNDSQLLFGD